MKKLIVLLILAAAGLGIFLLMKKGCAKTAENTAAGTSAKTSAYGKALDRSNAMNCRHNLQQIHQMLLHYQISNRRFPVPDGVDGLRLLISEGLPQRILRCPQQSGDFNEDVCAFVYFGGTWNKLQQQNLPLLIEKPGRHGDSVNILFANGKVAVVTVENYASVAQAVKAAVPAQQQKYYLNALKKINVK